jgi:hypothetical protein
VFADLVNGADIGMVQRRGSFGFTLEAAERLRILRYIVRKELQGDETTKIGVLCFVDDAHPTAAEFFDDAVMGDGLADHGAMPMLCGESCGVNLEGKTLKKGKPNLEEFEESLLAVIAHRPLLVAS